MRKRITTILVCIALLTAFLVPTVSAVTFRDVPSGKWYSAGVNYCAGKGYVSGYNDGIFQPDRNITRAEMAAIISNMLGLSGTSTVSFTDVPSGQWYSAPISRCVKAGVISGYGNGKFGPNDRVTREQAAVILGNAFGLGHESGIPDFRDEGSISTWALYYVNSMISHGYMSGMGNNLFSPKSALTRGQIVTIIYAREKDISDRASLGSDGWKQAYIDYIRTGDGYGAWDSATLYRLVDVDGDGIPELHRVGGSISQGNSLVGFYHGRLEEMYSYAPGIKVDKGKGKLCCAELENGRRETAYRYYSLNDGKFRLLHTGYDYMPTASRDGYFTWDGVRVSESEFYNRCNSVFVFEDVPNSEMIRQSDIISRIQAY